MERLLRSCGAVLILGLTLAAGPAKAGSYTFENIMPAEVPGDLLVTTHDLAGDTIFDGGVAFADEYYFDLVDPGTPGLTVSVLFEFENVNDAQSSVPLTIKLFIRDGGIYSLLVAEDAAETVAFTRVLATTPTAVQQYLLTITGTAPPELTAGYSGKLTVTAVPEPSTVLLLLAGLALVTTALRSTRRSQRLAVRSR